MIRSVKWSLVFALICSQNVFGQHSRIFPQPQNCVTSTDVFEFNGKLTVQFNEEFLPMFEPLAKQFLLENGTVLEIAKEKANISLVESNIVTDGYYHLEITKSGIRIEYADYQGIFYAFESLIQQTISSSKIEGAVIDDWPSFGYRGVHLDCARHFFTIAELKDFIDQMARLKFNKFHWHLTDDQGWRLEIKKYPKLTEIGAWRDQTLVGHFSDTPVVYDGKRYGGFYTQEDAKELIKYAADRGIEIIPEIEMPGHARAALAAYPELGCTGIQQGVAETWGVFDDVFCSKEETLTFLEGVLDEVCDLFPSQTIHIGGDESPKTRWKVCPACQQQIKDNGLHDEHELQSFVVQRMSAYLNAKGKTLMGWDEILEGGLAENAQVMSWRGTEGGIAAAKAGHKVVMTPTSYCYFDYYQSGSPGEPLAIGGYLPLEKVYSFDPIPNELSQKDSIYILGGQANLWTEYLPDMNAVYYNAFPRLVAMSEVLWTREKNRKSYNEFVVGLNSTVFPYFEKRKVNYSRAAFEPKVIWDSTETGIKLSMDYPLKEATLGFHLIGHVGINKYARIVLPIAYVDRSNESQEHYYNAEVSIDNQVVGENLVKIISHLALGKKLNFITQPSEKYNVHGSMGLTDGVVGQMPWKGNQWLGFEEDTVQFELDFGLKTKFSNIKLGYLDDPGSWIYAPVECVVEYSKDGETWVKAKATVDKSDSFWLHQKLNVRYLRITTINKEKIPEGQTGAGFTPWTFLDELIITK